jgi:hypothetical protein
MAGRPRTATIASSSRTTRKLGSEVSAMSARHSRVKSSTNGEDAEAAAVSERVRLEIQAPTLIGALRHGQRRPGSQGTLAPTTAAHLKPFLAVEAAQLLVVHDQTFAGQKDMETTVAEAAALGGQVA